MWCLSERYFILFILSFRISKQQIKTNMSLESIYKVLWRCLCGCWCISMKILLILSTTTKKKNKNIRIRRSIFISHSIPNKYILFFVSIRICSEFLNMIFIDRWNFTVCVIYIIYWLTNRFIRFSRHSYRWIDRYAM